MYKAKNHCSELGLWHPLCGCFLCWPYSFHSVFLPLPLCQWLCAGRTTPSLIANLPCGCGFPQEPLQRKTNSLQLFFAFSPLVSAAHLLAFVLVSAYSFPRDKVVQSNALFLGRPAHWVPWLGTEEPAFRSLSPGFTTKATFPGCCDEYTA